MTEYRINLYAPDGRLDYQLLCTASTEDEARKRALELAEGKRFTVERWRKMNCSGELSD